MLNGQGGGGGKWRQLYSTKTEPDIPKSFYRPTTTKTSVISKFNVNISQRKITFPAPFANATIDDKIQSLVVISFCVAVGSSRSIVAF